MTCLGKGSDPESFQISSNVWVGVAQLLAAERVRALRWVQAHGAARRG